MFIFHNFFKGVGSGRGLAPSQIVIVTYQGNAFLQSLLLGVHTLQEYFYTVKSLTDCTSLLCCLCNSGVMAVCKPVHFEEVINITSCNDILLYFLRKNAFFNFDSVCTRCGQGLCYFH